MKKQDILEEEVDMIYLSVGSNLGDRIKNLQKTKFYILKNNIEILGCSSIYETESWPNKNFPKFLNIIIKIKTNMKLEELFTILKSIEKKMGRLLAPKNYPRICDIDIIDYCKLNIILKYNNCEIVVPHPRMFNRNFVLIPLFELNGSWKHPKNGLEIVKLISNLPSSSISSIKIY